MNEKFDPQDEPVKDRTTDDSNPGNAGTNRQTNGAPQFKNGLNGHAPARHLDFWTFADIFAHRWHWMVICGIIFAGGFLALAGLVVKPKFTASAQLIRQETPTINDFLRTPPMTSETFAGILRSPDLLRRMGDKLSPPIPPHLLGKMFKAEPQPDSDIIRVVFAARDPQSAVQFANLYMDEAVGYTRELQATQALQLAQVYLKQQLKDMDEDMNRLREEFLTLGMGGPVTNKLAEVGTNLNAMDQQITVSPKPSIITARLAENMQKLMTELNDLLLNYKDAHPSVIQKRAQIKEIEDQITGTSTNEVLNAALTQAGMGGMLGMNAANQNFFHPEFDIIRTKLRSFEEAHIQMVNRQREAQMYADNPPGLIRIFAPATLKTTESNHRRVKIALLTVFGGGVGMLAGLLLVMLVEFVDNRLKTADDVRRVTRLPVLTTLGDLTRMKAGMREQWAFRTWTMLQGRLSRSQTHGLVCGITSSTEGEGRSTWISLLAEAASLSGFRVLTIATRPSPTPVGDVKELTEETLDNHANMNPSSQYPEYTESDDPQNQQIAKTADNVLTSPAQVTEQLTGPNSQPVVHIPLPGWVWNLERRKQWRNALNHWRQIDNLVIFVELPPASVPEAVLLGSHLPNLVWLTDSGTAKAGETRTHIETLRNARCNLVGAVLNREQSKPMKQRFPRWLGCVAAALLAVPTAIAQPAAQPAAERELAIPADSPPVADSAPASGNFSVLSRTQRAPWQERLTLGPGDVLNFSLFGEPLSTRAEVAIAPDGRVSYMEANDILATGLTIDELRARFDEELGRVRRAPRTIITPVSYKSKKYYVLGKVVQRGVYVLDRPITVVEALARAQGLENGLVDGNTIDLADLPRSFLMRKGKRYSLNFERLFQAGDLSQNIQIEPDDYLYFPSATIKEVYVLGEVGLPGMVTYRPDSTVLTVISARGGFNERAYKQRVLVVRGSLNKPQTFAINTLDITNGEAPDFRLEPKDIVYVSHRPWYRAEDLLDAATTAFVQSIVTAWVGVDVLDPR